jgi:TonB-dependent receptor
VPAGEQTLVVSFIGYETATETVTISANRTRTLDVELTRATVGASEVVVEARRGALRTLETKRQATGILDVIDQETVQSLPVQDMTEALDQLPAVNIQGQSAGRGFRSSFVVVRGIQPNLNNVTVMGMPLVSTQADRAVALDILPSGMVSQLGVTKAVTPDMNANTIGGSVNLVPFSAFDRKGSYVSASVEGGTRNEQGALEGDRLPLNANVIGSTRLGGSFGVAGALNYTQEEFSRTVVQPDDWEAIPKNDPSEQGIPDDLLIPEGTRLEQTQSSFERFSGTLSLEWNPNPDRNVQVLGSYTESTNEENSTQTEWNYADGKNGITFEQRDDGIFSPVGNNDKEADFDVEEETMFFTIGKGVFRFNDFQWILGGGYVRSESEEEVREWQFNSVNFESVIDMSSDVPWGRPVDADAFRDPANYPFDEIDVEPWDKEAESFQVSTDLTYDDVGALGSDGFVQVGGLFRNESTMANRLEQQFEEASGMSTLADMGVFRDIEGVGGNPIAPAISEETGPAFIDENPNFLELNEGASIDDRIEGTWDVDETVVAGYGMATGTYGDVTVTGGLRVEYTETEPTIQTFNEQTEEFGEENFSNTYTNVLPNLHVRYRFNEDVQVRAAGTYTISRPGLTALGQSRNIDFDNGDILQGSAANPTRVSSADLEQGNPDLDPFKSFNFDATLEYYPGEGSFYTVGLFFKNIDDPIFTQDIDRSNVTLAGTTYNDLTVEQPLNAESGTLRGIEAQVQETFTFLPSLLRGLGVSADGAFLDSEFTIPGREAERLPFFRQPETVLSIEPFWRYRGFEARLSYQYTDEFVVGFGSVPSQDEYVDNREQLDLQLKYTVPRRLASSRLSLSAGVENLTNESFRSFQGQEFRPTNIDKVGQAVWFGVSAEL